MNIYRIRINMMFFFCILLLVSLLFITDCIPIKDYHSSSSSSSSNYNNIIQEVEEKEGEEEEQQQELEEQEQEQQRRTTRPTNENKFMHTHTHTYPTLHSYENILNVEIDMEFENENELQLLMDFEWLALSNDEMKSKGSPFLICIENANRDIISKIIKEMKVLFSSYNSNNDSNNDNNNDNSEENQENDSDSDDICIPVYSDKNSHSNCFICKSNVDIAMTMMSKSSQSSLRDDENQQGSGDGSESGSGESESEYEYEYASYITHFDPYPSVLKMAKGLFQATKERDVISRSTLYYNNNKDENENIDENENMDDEDFMMKAMGSAASNNDKNKNKNKVNHNNNEDNNNNNNNNNNNSNNEENDELLEEFETKTFYNNDNDNNININDNIYENLDRIRVVMLPGFHGGHERLKDLSIHWYRMLQDEEVIRIYLEKNFYWFSDSNRRRRQQQLEEQIEMESDEIESESDKFDDNDDNDNKRKRRKLVRAPPNIRHDNWIDSIESSTNSAVSSESSDNNNKCRFDKIGIESNMPYLILHSLDFIGETSDSQTACLITLEAFLISQPETMYLEYIPDATVTNMRASWVIQSNIENYRPLWDLQLYGQGQIIQVADTGLDTSSCWFSDDKNGDLRRSAWDDLEIGVDVKQRKVINYVAWADGKDVKEGHGTHVCGTIAGSIEDALPGDSSYDGVAPKAKISFFDIGIGKSQLSIPSNLDRKMFQPAYDIGTRIHSNSWGTQSNNYLYGDVEIDTYMYEYEDALVIFAVGNSGERGLNSVYSPALSKNGLGIGASETYIPQQSLSPEYVAFFSSLGPTGDGRIKPDVLGPGYKVTSANAKGDNGNCKIKTLFGTSMAAPAVAGNAAIIRQYFREGYYPTGEKSSKNRLNPSGALLKAILINSASAMEAYKDKNGLQFKLGSPPDFYQGFGRIQLTNSLKFDDTIDMFVQNKVSISEGQAKSYKFKIISHPDLTTPRPFCVTLTWTDPPTSASSKRLVIHDLDLAIRSNSGKRYYPNNRNGPDDKNNVEKIFIEDAMPGDIYIVTISASVVSASDYQNFALAVNGNFIQVVES